MGRSAVQAGEKAEAALARALANQPNRDGEAFTEATERLCEMRDALIGQCRAGAGSEPHLGRLNAVISSAMTGQFPLGKTDWILLETARSALHSLLDELRDLATP